MALRGQKGGGYVTYKAMEQVGLTDADVAGKTQAEVEAMMQGGKEKITPEDAPKKSFKQQVKEDMQKKKALLAEKNKEKNLQQADQIKKTYQSYKAKPKAELLSAAKHTAKIADFSTKTPKADLIHALMTHAFNEHWGVAL